MLALRLTVHRAWLHLIATLHAACTGRLAGEALGQHELPQDLGTTIDLSQKNIHVYTQAKLCLQDLELVNGRYVFDVVEIGGGALQVQDAELRMSRCRIKDCISEVDGGAVGLFTGSKAILSQCAFESN